jgi:hypothetical protein
MIVNRLSLGQQNLKVINSGSNWRTTNFTLYDYSISEMWQSSELRQIGLKPVDGELDSTIYLSGIPLFSQDIGKKVVFTFAIKIANGGLVNVHISDDNNALNSSSTDIQIDATTPSINISGVASPQWRIIRCNSITVSSAFAPSISIVITINGVETGNPIYFTIPTLYMKNDMYLDNPAMSYIVPKLPLVLNEIDIAVTEPVDSPMWRFIDIATQGLAKAVEETLDFQYLDTSEKGNVSGPGSTSTLVQTPEADLPTLIWLAKFTGTTPVTRFVSSLAPADPFILDESTLDGVDTIRFSSYSNLNPVPVDLEEQKRLLRWQIDNAYYGRNSGSKNALINAAKLMLIGFKNVELEYDYAINPFEITLTTFWFETIGADETMIGNSSSVLLEAVNAAKPLGVKLSHIMTDVLT